MSPASPPKRSFALPAARAVLALLVLGSPLIARDAPAATGFACGDGKPNLAAKKCDCPAGKVESTSAKGVSSCVDAPRPSTTSKPVGSTFARPPAPAGSTSAGAVGTSGAASTSGASGGSSVKCPAGMVAIPAGTFPLEETKKPMSVGAFCVDVNEVTVADYSACVAANACARAPSYSADPKLNSQLCNAGRAGRALHPINCLVWEEASAYCSFAKKRLLADEEWEWLARNGDQASKYPWGAGAPDESRANVCGAECPPHVLGMFTRQPKAMFAGDDGFAETAPVGSFPKGQNRWGVNDLAGNVWEWTATSDVSPKDGSSMKIMRGGSFLSEDPLMLQSGLRAVEKPDSRIAQIGVRCAKGP